ncbi:MAG: MBL fold metallo-hydrolase [Sphingomonadales bacterium]|jgi:glyoxylase-like metal-dependent hydrolase (beta-lactamase superfamily II)
MKLKLALGLVLLGATSLSANAQGRFDDVEITTEKVGDHIYALFGAGGNIGVSAGDDGVFVIDDQFDELNEKIVTAIRDISDKPIRFLVNTHWHGDHSGGNEAFATKQHTLIFAHDNVRKRMSQSNDRGDGNVIPASPEEALPVITFSEANTFHLNGEAVKAIHIAHAHTDGDAIVHFTKSNVIHMGDTYFNGGFPYIDVDSGGNVYGMIEAADKALSLADDETRIIPGHGEMATKADLQSYRDMLALVVSRAEALVEEGKTLDEIKSAGISKEYDKELGTAFIKPDFFATTIYESIQNRH